MIKNLKFYVLNSLIFPFHEQHHNNSFLCAALLNGQTNIAAGATIGSNHNSRSPDGELIAGRGFWPGLCVSLKHNSSFASFTIIAKGDFSAELNIPVPFCLVSNDITNDMLVVMPGYWFMYNMYALARNSWKYTDRDKRTEKKQLIEHEFLAPDTINEMIRSLELFKMLTGQAWLNANSESDANTFAVGERLLETNDAVLKELEIFADGFENSTRKTKLIKVPACYTIFKKLINYHAANLLINFINENNIKSFAELQSALPEAPLHEWKNIGGQLIKSVEIDSMESAIHNGHIDTWEGVHEVYKQQAVNYPMDKLQHALAAATQVNGFSLKDPGTLINLLKESMDTRKWMVTNIFSSREKDYTNAFRLMVYANAEEMDKVIGSIDDNQFIKQEEAALHRYLENVEKIIGTLIV